MLSESGAMDRPAFHRVVLEHDLQVDRQRDHRAAQADLLKQLSRDSEPEQLGLEQVRVQQHRLARALAPHQPPGQEPERDHPERKQQTDRLTAFLPHQDAQHHAAHAENRQDGTHDIHAPRPGVFHITDQPDAQQHDRDDDVLKQERDPP